jgi:glycosyltransferase involved in cell wall biosynthesis
MSTDSNNQGKYSCLISLYSKENPEYLCESLNCLINQTVPPDEILVVKDGQLTEQLEIILDDYKSLYPGLFSFVSYEENRGLWYALRQGVPACRNEIIMRMDVDDVSTLDRAAKELKVLQEHSEIGCVGSNVTEFENNVNHPVALVNLPEKHEDIVAFGKKRCPFRHPSLMYRKSVVLAAGNYQEMPLFEDYDLYMRLFSTGCKFYNIQESLVYMRTSQDFYARRGSYEYMKKMLHFKIACLKRGNYTVGEFLYCTIPHMIVCLMPNSLRKFVYQHMLRSKVPATPHTPSSAA